MQMTIQEQEKYFKRRKFLATTVTTLLGSALASLCEPRQSNADSAATCRPGPTEDISRDVFPATKKHPRNGEGSIIQLQNGALLFATKEFFISNALGDAHIVAKSSSDGGCTWGPSRELQKNIGRDNVMSVTLRRLPKYDCRPAPIGMFYLVTNSHSDLRAYLRVSYDETKSFGEPVLVTPLDGYNVQNNNRVTVLSAGRLLAPVAWSPDYAKHDRYISFRLTKGVRGNINAISNPRKLHTAIRASFSSVIGPLWDTTLTAHRGSARCRFPGFMVRKTIHQSNSFAS